MGRKTNNNDESFDAAASTKRDTDLPDDFSIFGGSSVTSSNDAVFDHFDKEGDDDVNVELGESGASSRTLKLVDALSLASTLSSEKQSKKREGMLRSMFTAITTCATGTCGRDILDNYWTLVFHACSYSMAGKGNAKPSEQYTACRVIEACSVILGGDRDDVVVSVDEPLRKVVNATGRSTQVRVAALRCLSMMHFICGTDCLEDGMDCASLMDLCEKIGGETRYRGDNTPSLLRATALDCWSLLSTTFHDSELASGDSSGDLGRGLRMLPILASCLDSPDAALRHSAGEAVSMIHECRLRMGLEEDEAVNTTERKFRIGSWDGTEWEVLMDDLKQRIADLAVESSHHMSKQAKKDQRSSFRDYMRTVVDDLFPDEVVSWRSGRLTLTSWKEIIQLNFVRHCLQGGFHVQLINNETLHAIFGAKKLDAGTSSLSQIQKRMLLSKTSDAAKAADKDMMKQRRIRTNKKNHFLTADGDNI